MLTAKTGDMQGPLSHTKQSTLSQLRTHPHLFRIQGCRVSGCSGRILHVVRHLLHRLRRQVRGLGWLWALWGSVATAPRSGSHCGVTGVASARRVTANGDWTQTSVAKGLRGCAGTAFQPALRQDKAEDW